MSNAALKALAYALQTPTREGMGVPVILWGSPGSGKTKSLYAIAKAMGREMETVIASLRDPTDFGGLPAIHNGSVTLHPPAWAQRLKEHKGVLFLDEISTSPPAVQAALLRVVFERVVGEMQLPYEVSIVAAANPVEEAAGGWELTPPVMNRFCHIHWDVNPKQWTEGFATDFKDEMEYPVISQKEWAKQWPIARSHVAGFINHRPDLLQMKPTEDGKPWPTARTWEYAARLYATCRAAKKGRGEEWDDALPTLLEGCIGEGAMLEFLTWLQEADLPNPEDLLKNPKKAELPKRGDLQFAVIQGILAVVRDDLTHARWQAAWEVLNRIADDGVDIAATGAKGLADMRKDTWSFPRSIEKFFPIIRQASEINRALRESQLRGA